MRRLRQPVRTANSLLRQAIRQVSAVPVLTGSMLLVLGSGADAITLGDVRVESALGQRLSATVPVRLDADESLAGGCVTTGQQAADLRPVPGARLSVPDASRAGVYELRVTSGEPLDEPMYALELAVQCPGTPILVRQYVLMLDLPGAVATAAPAAAPVPAVAPAAAPAARPAAAPPAPRARPAVPVEGGTTYRVAEGDTLSGIAARVQGRQVSLQAMADAIQAANPDAFIRNDPNLIKLGSVIAIPGTLADAAGAKPAPAAAAAEPASVAPGVPSPSLPPVLDAVPAPAGSVTPAPAEPATVAEAPPVAPAPAAIAPDLARDAAPAATAATAARPRPAPVVDEVAAETPAAAPEPNPFVAAGAGIAFGLLVSGLLWFRGKLPSRSRAAKAAPAASKPVPGATALPAAPVPLVTRQTEPGLTVSFTPAQEDALAAEFAPEPAAPAPSMSLTQAPVDDITSELEELFDGTDTTIQKRLEAEKTLAARSGIEDDGGYAPEIAPGEDVDFLLGDPTGEHPSGSGSTVEQPRPNMDATAQSPTVDLRTLATAATGDQQQAQTLLEALTLLERDYEEELTASQVLDMSAVREALGTDADEPTQISDARLRDAARKKQR